MGLVAGERTVETVSGFLSNHFTDHSQSLSNAMQKATERAWQALEIALAGEKIWNVLDTAEHKAFRQQVRNFLQATSLVQLPGEDKDYNQRCLAELREARKKKILSGDLEPQALAQQLGEFARYDDPQSVLNAEWQIIENMALACKEMKFHALAQLVSLKTSEEGQPLLVVAVRYFFRREIETDSQLYQGLTWAKFEVMQSTQEQAFAGLSEVLTAHHEQVVVLLDSVRGLVAETHQAVHEVQNDIHKMAEKLDLLHRELRPRDSLSINNEAERQLVKQLVARYRALPEEERQQFPSMLNELGKLEVATGSFAAAQKDFAEAAQLSQDQSQQAEAHFNRYSAALEQGEWQTALEALQTAAELDANKYAPFPLHKYEPERILGAGGFGVAFLCRNRHTEKRMVVKTLRSDTLDRTLNEVFREAQVLEELEHSAIIRLRDCDYADADMTRPYLVMDYFAGQTLEDYIEKNGTLSPEEAMALMRPVAEALQAAHKRGILHRDVKPGNLLVQKESGKSTPWRVKLIDFGLAMKQNVLHSTAGGAVSAQTITGYSIAGTLDYAAPEQMGKLPGVAVGPYTDVYGLAKTFCYALFKTTQPLRKHWREIPDELADLLEQCLSESPDERLPDLGRVLQALDTIEHGEIGRPSVSATGEVGRPAPNTTDEVGSDFGAGLLTSPTSEFGAGLPTSPNETEFGAGLPTSPNETEFGAGLPTSPTDSTAGLPTSPTDTKPPLPTTPASKPSSPDWWKQTPAAASKPSQAGLAHQLTGHTRAVQCLAFSADGQWLVSGSEDYSLRLWNVQTGEAVQQYYGHTDAVWHVAFLPGSRGIISSSVDQSVRIWDLNSAEELDCFRGRTHCSLAISPDGELALTGNISDGMIRLWMLENGRELRRLKGHMSWVMALAFSPNNRQALSGSSDCTVRLWDVHSGRELRRMQGHTETVTSVTFAPGGNLAASSSADKTVRLWDIRTGKEVKRYDNYQSPVQSVAISPDGRLAISDQHGGKIRMWQLGSDTELGTLQCHTENVLSVTFSPDGEHFASGGEDKTVCIWQLPR